MPRTALKREQIILASLAERNARMMSSCRAITTSALTEAERASILPNAALVDRENIQLLLAPPSDVDAGPAGATDLTNPINRPKIAVSLHPVISLHEDIIRWLESKSQMDLGRRGRRISANLSEMHAGSLKFRDCKVEWPDLRKNWESAIGKKWPIPVGYKRSARKNRDGVSPESLALSLATYGKCIPSLARCDLDIVTSEAIKRMGDNPESRNGAVADTRRAQLVAEEKLNKWGRLNGVLLDTYLSSVEVPMVEQGKAWTMTCKNFSKADELDLAGYLEEVYAFTAQNGSPVEQMVIAQATETALLTMMTPSSLERFDQHESAIWGWVAKNAASAMARSGIKHGTAMADEAIKENLGLKGRLMYRLAKELYRTAGSPGGKILETNADHLIGRATEYVRKSIETEQFIDAAREQLNDRLDIISTRDHISDDHLPMLLGGLSTEGRRVAHLMGQIHVNVSNPKIVKRFRDAVSKRDPSELAEEIAAEVRKSPSEPYGFNGLPTHSFSVEGSMIENSTSARAILSILARNHFPQVASFCSEKWVKGVSRLYHVPQLYHRHLERLALPSGDLPPEKLAEEQKSRAKSNSLFYLAQALDGEVAVSSTGHPALTPRGLSHLTSSVELTMASRGIKSPSREARGDWPVTMAINIALSAGSMSPEQLSLSAMAPTNRENRFDELEPLSSQDSREAARKATAARIRMVGIQSGLVVETPAN